MAMLTTASQLERICGKLPDPNAADPTEDESVLWDFAYRTNPDGTATITAPIAEASAARAAIQAKTSEVISRQQGKAETKTDVINRLGGLSQLNADTAIAICSGTVDVSEEPQAPVMVVTDIETLTGADETAECTVDHVRVDPEVVPVSYTHLTLPTTPYV